MEAFIVLVANKSVKCLHTTTLTSLPSTIELFLCSLISSNKQAPPHSPHSFAAPLPALCTYTTTLQYMGCTQTNNTLRRLLTNVKDKDKLEDRQGAVYKIKCCDCQASYIGKTGRNLSTRLTEHKRATRNGDVNNHIAEHHLKTKHQIDWDSATCITYSTDYYQRLTLESWFTNLEQTPLNRSQQLPAPYKRLIDEIKQN